MNKAIAQAEAQRMCDELGEEWVAHSVPMGNIMGTSSIFYKGGARKGDIWVTSLGDRYKAFYQYSNEEASGDTPAEALANLLEIFKVPLDKS